MAKYLTRGNPAKLIFFFALPLFIGNLFQQLYSIADTLIVGRILGLTALAGVGCTGSLLFLILGFVMGMTSGFSIVTAQYYGARNKTGVRRSFCAAVILAVVVAILFTLITVPLTRSILTAMLTPPEIMADAHAYLLIIFCGIGASVLFNLLSNMILALGDSKTPLVFLIIACLLNIVLDFAFILHTPMGVAGAALATVLSQIASGLLCVRYIFKKLPELRPHKKDWLLTLHDLYKPLSIGLPMGFQISVIAVGAIVLQAALNNLGPLSVAAYTAAQKIDMIGVLPMMSFGLAMATYTAQNYGARDLARISQGVRQCCVMSVSFSVAVAAVNITFGRYLIELFVGDGQDAVIEMGQIYLTINGCMYWILALLFIFRNTLQGLGQSAVPTLAGVMELVMRTLAAVTLTAYLGFNGACMANPLAWLGAAVPLCIAYCLTIRCLCRDGRPA
ncbi:MAG: MATE family efflux transporter [Desulfovibrio sp.]|jgi:putative MATE family efflux protein|nr:MATE family efflux transporter [Desulfovibrio sp.]